MHAHALTALSIVALTATAQGVVCAHLATDATAPTHARIVSAGLAVLSLVLAAVLAASL